MSQSTIAQRKSSPCCIGCIVLLVILLGFSVAIGIYMYRFAKDNISLVEVAGKPDPAVDTAPEVLMPETVGQFQRTSLGNTLENVSTQYWGDIDTSGVHVAVYEDERENSITVIALSTEDAQDQRDMGMGPLMTGRGKANSPNTGFSIRDPFSGDVPNTIITWQKPNWTFMVQTTSTAGLDFVEAFNPGGGVVLQQETTGTEEMVTDTAPAEPVATPAEVPAEPPSGAALQTTETL